jgi:hypothetical protein
LLTDQGLEVEETCRRRASPHRLRREGTTSCALPTTRGQVSRWPVASWPNHTKGVTNVLGLPGAAEAIGVRTRTAVDVKLLAARGKLRRVERQRERLEDVSCPPRRGGCSTLVFGRARAVASATSELDTPRGAGEEVLTNSGFGRSQSEPGGAEGANDLKLGEPHDRFQGATNLRRARWRKPSKPRETARAERVRKVAAPDRKWHRATG